MDLEEILKEWEMFGQTLRKPDSDYFKEFLDGIKKYENGIESQEHRHTEALFMALVLQNQKIINELIEKRRADSPSVK